MSWPVCENGTSRTTIPGKVRIHGDNPCMQKLSATIFSTFISPPIHIVHLPLLPMYEPVTIPQHYINFANLKNLLLKKRNTPSCCNVHPPIFHIFRHLFL